MSTMRRYWFYTLPIVVLSLITFSNQRSYGSVAGTPATLGTPTAIATFGTTGDQRDIDYFPQVAYDANHQRFLTVWLTPRNVSLINTLFDVYGIFLDQDGLPIGNQFRISDANSVARNGPPAVAAGNGEFVVVWTKRTSTCQFVMQKVTDSSVQQDQQLPLGSGSDLHSPSLVFNPMIGHYVLTYVAGTDYLPPVLFGTDISTIADCGNNQTSKSEIKISEFHLNGSIPSLDKTVTVSDQAAGSFRPKLGYNSAQNSYFALWEDRRNAGGNNYQFAVYGQRLAANLAVLGENIELHSNSSYENGDNSATWTPRPAVIAGTSQFFTVWFEQEKSQNTTTWSVQGRFISADTVSDPFTVSRMTFTQSHIGDAPSGFLVNSFEPQNQEYLVALSSHTESPSGYLSSVRSQRVTANGEPLRLDGSPRTTLTIGDKLDIVLDIQLMPSLVAYEHETEQRYLIAYSKHAPGKHAQDFDIWSNHVVLNTASLHTPTTTNTPIPTFTMTATPTHSPTVTTEPNSPTATTIATNTPIPTSTMTVIPIHSPTATVDSNRPTATEVETVAVPTSTLTVTPIQTPHSEQYLPVVIR